MPEGSLRSLERRRDRKRRNRQFAAGVLALLIAAAGVGGGLFALRTSPGPKPAVQTPTPTPAPGSQARPSPVSGPIQFIDDQRGWMVDGGGQILATIDGGRNWHVQLSGHASVTAIAILDSQLGWAVFDGGLLRTTDGGAHWDTWSNQALSSVQFITAKIGWGLAAAPQVTGVLVRSTDGGRTWSEVPTPNQIESFSFADSSNGWAAGGISLLRTMNGGQTWTGGPLAEFGLGDFGLGEPWTATVRCAPNGKEAFVLLRDGGAAGHVAYVVWQAADDGQGGYSIQFVIQEAGTHPLGSGYSSVYNSEDPYPGPFTVVGPGSAYFLNWCPSCGGALPSVSFTMTGGQPADVTNRFPVVVGGPQAQPVGVSFLPPEGSNGLSMRGWALIELSGDKGPNQMIFHTVDGGRTWTQWPVAIEP